MFDFSVFDYSVNEIDNAIMCGSPDSTSDTLPHEDDVSLTRDQPLICTKECDSCSILSVEEDYKAGQNETKSKTKVNTEVWQSMNGNLMPDS
jgi:hypothetical protein